MKKELKEEFFETFDGYITDNDFLSLEDLDAMNIPYVHFDNNRDQRIVILRLKNGLVKGDVVELGFDDGTIYMLDTNTIQEASDEDLQDIVRFYKRKIAEIEFLRMPPLKR